MAFYEQLDEDRFRSTVATRGPWSPDHQHAGPPAALLGAAVAETLGANSGDGRVVRITYEVLRPVPITDLTVATAVDRGGRRVALASGALHDEDGPVLLARAWRLRELGERVPEADRDVEPLPAPADCPVDPFWDLPWDEGYHVTMEVRSVRGGITEHGDACVWMRSTVDVVEDRPITPLERVLVAADSGNGISARFDPAEVLFVNTDLTVHLRELPEGEFVGFDAATRFGPDGIGLATTTIHGTQGPIGIGAQSLLVEEQRRD